MPQVVMNGPRDKLAHRLRLAASFLALSALAACSSGPVAHLPPAPRNVAPDVEFAETLPPYRVQIGDTLELKFLLNPELNEVVTVRPDGKISTAAVAEFPVYGRTVAQINDDLKEAYRPVLKTVNVSAIVRSFAPNRIYVGGEVGAPGEFITIGPNLSLTQAITRAGGMRNSAMTDRIVILRRGAGEHPQVFEANFDAAAYGGDPSADVRLATYDVVFVPRSGVADVYVAFQQYAQQFLPTTLGAGVSLTTKGLINN